jgi:hypothetical protein
MLHNVETAHEPFSEQYWVAFEALSDPLTAAVMFEPISDSQGKLVDFRYKMANRTYLWLTGQNEQALTSTTLRTADPELVSAGAATALIEAFKAGGTREFPTRWEHPAVGRVDYTATAFRAGQNAVLVCRLNTDLFGPSGVSRHDTGNGETSTLTAQREAVRHLLVASTFVHSFAAQLQHGEQDHVYAVIDKLDDVLKTFRQVLAEHLNRTL